MAFRIASGCKRYEDEDEEEDGDDDEWRVVKELFHQSINQLAEAGRGVRKRKQPQKPRDRKKFLSV